MSKKPQLKAALTRLEAFLRKINQPSAPLASGPLDDDLVMLSRRRYGSVTLVGGDAREYHECVAILQAALPMPERFSRRAIQELVQNAIFLTLGRQGPLFDRRLKKAIAAIQSASNRSAKRWRILLPVAGAKLERGQPVRFGHGVFRAPRPNTLRTIIRDMHDIQKETRASEAEKQRLMVETARQVREGYADAVIADLRMTAFDRDAAIEQAKTELARTLDVLNCFGDLLHSTLDLRPMLAFPGEDEPRRMLVLAFEENVHVSVLAPVRGQRLPFDLSILRSQRGTVLHLHRVSRLLRDQAPRAASRRIVSALRWAGRATASRRRDEAFLHFVIALESLMLPPQREGEIGYRLRVRVAHWLGGNLDNRRKNAKHVTATYGTRSQIAHAGVSDVTDDEMRIVRQLVKATLIVALHSRRLKLFTEDKVDEWLDAKVFR